MEEKEILIDDLKINYKIAGEGLAILILHGWSSKSEKWQKVGELLAKNGFKIIVPDLPGFGKTKEPPESWGLDDYCNLIQKFVISLNLEKFYLLGHSFGGSLAIKFVLKYPQKIKKLFLIAPTLVRKKTLKKEIIKKTAKIFSFLPSFIKKIIYRKIIKSDYPLTEGPMRKTYLRVINEDLSTELSKISVSTVLIWGEKDDVTPLADAYLIKEKVANFILKIIPGANHDLNIKFPEKISEIISK